MYLRIITGTLIVTASTVWPIAWLGIEINLIRFLCIIKKKSRILIYFLVQSIGTLGLLGRMIWIPPLLIVFLILKLGFFPFYHWIVKLLINEEYWRGTILLTWQKVAPLSLLCYSNPPQSILIINAIVGVYLLFSSNHLLLILLFSGLAQGSWVRLMIPSMFTFTYFFAYSIIIIILTSNDSTRGSFFFTFIALAGFPPLTGFIIKLKAISLISANLVIILLLLSVIPIYCYMRFMLSQQLKSPGISIVSLIGAFLGLVIY